MKFLKNITLLIIIFYLGQWIIAKGLDRLITHSSFRLSKVFSKDNPINADILCLGNSRGVNSFFSPHINNSNPYRAYNLSYNGMRMPTIAIFTEQYLKHNKVPRTVFIEISNIFNQAQNIEYSKYNLYANKSASLNKGIKNTDVNTYAISAIFPLFRFNSELFYRSLYYNDDDREQQWINRYSISKELEIEIDKLPNENFPLNLSDLKNLKELQSELINLDIQVILFIAPIHPQYFPKIENLEILKSKIESITGTKVIDLSNLISKSEYFADKIHTNIKGAEIISDTLINLVKD